MPRGRPRKKGSGARIQSAELINWALGGIEREIAETRQRLAGLIAQAGQLRRRAGLGRVGGTGTDTLLASAPGPKTRRRRRKLSADARKKISDRMTRRWAEWRKKHSK
jgi:hypothetical protein